MLTVSEYTMAERSATSNPKKTKEPTAKQELVPEELAGSRPLNHAWTEVDDIMTW